MSIKEAKKKKLLSQKDLEHRWGCVARTVQRARREFGLVPVDFGGMNPLFTKEDVERVEAERIVKRLKSLSERGAKISAAHRRRNGQLMSIKEIRALARKQHMKGLSQ